MNEAGSRPRRPAARRVGIAALAIIGGLGAVLLLGAGLSALLGESGRNRPMAVARIDGTLWVLQKACPGEDVAKVEISPANTKAMDAGQRVMVVSHTGGVPPDESDVVRIPLDRATDGWTMTDHLPRQDRSYWLSEAEDANGMGFAGTVLPFTPARISDGRATSSDAGTIRVTDWLQRRLNCGK